MKNFNSLWKSCQTFWFTIFFGLLFVSCLPHQVLQEEAKGDGFKFKMKGGADGPTSDLGPDDDDLEIFKVTVYPLVAKKTCVNCHGSGQSPKFAVADPAVAYKNLLSAGKVDLVDPQNSRIVRKIVDQSHNCWSDCQTDSDEMLAAVEIWAKASSSQDQGLGSLKTSQRPMPTSQEERIAQTEYGTLILQAEQSDPEVLQGRYESFIDAQALGQAYIKGPNPPRNPIANTNRRASINRAKCTTPPASSITNNFDGAYRVREDSTHISSNSRISAATSQVVRDGFTPFSYRLEGFLIRPDRRIERAKTLFQPTTNLVTQVITTGKFQRVAKREGVKAPILQGTAPLVNSGNFEILPHFVSWNEVFESNGTFKAKGNLFEKDDGSMEDIYLLFSTGSYEPSVATLYKELRENPQIKRNILYKRIKEAAKAYLNNRSGEFSRVRKLDLEAFLSTEEVLIALDCRDEWVGFETELIDPARPDRGYKNCDPNDQNFPGSYSNLVYEMLSDKNSLTPLTYDNALDQLTLSLDETQIIPAGPSDISSGRWFHRIDLFAHFNLDIDMKNENGDIRYSYWKGESGAFKENESFSVETGLGVRGEEFWDLNRGEQKVDLSAIYVGSNQGLPENLELENFEQTLYPVIQQARCVDCHNDGAQARFAQENSSLALQVLKEKNLINFQDPANSFRGRGEGLVHRCNNNSTDPRYDCADDTNLKNQFVQAILDFKGENDADSTGDGLRGLSQREKTPGLARYNLLVNEDGYYNIWLRLKRAGNGDRNFNYRLLDSRGNPKPVFRNNSGRLIGVSGTCRDFSVNFDSWQWTTEGRQAERGNLGPSGEILLDDLGNPIPVPDNRIYFNLTAGEYTLEIFEDDLGLDIDLIAINKVKDLTDQGRLNFQPDYRTRDEKYISNYKRKVLKYDLSHLVNLQTGEEAFFEIEVEEEFGGQNYIFRAPRFTFKNSRNKVLKVSGIRGLINGKHEFTDSTYSQVNFNLGLGRAITYAPLVTLVPEPDQRGSDQFSFVFNKLEIADGGYSELSPKGELPKAQEERACLELALFKETVKPILKHVRVILNDSLDDFVDNFPGSPARPNVGVEFYRCMTCHNESHPFFKMTTFDYNDDILCKQAISRVNFENYYQSTLIRGINGTNNHPKFVFSEELEYADATQTNWELHDLSEDYLKEFALHPAGYKTRYINGPISKNSRSEMGLPASGFNSLSAADQLRAQKLGEFKGIRYMTIPTDTTQIGGYDEFLHVEFLGEIRGERDIIDPSHIPDPGTVSVPLIEIDPIVFDRDAAGRAMYYSGDHSSYGTSPRVSNYDDGRRRYDGLILNLQKDINEKVANPKVIDYREDLPGIQPRTDLDREFERLRSKYREAVINWIRAEDAAFKAQ